MKKIIMGLAFMAMTGIVKGQDYFHAFGVQANLGYTSISSEIAGSDVESSKLTFVPGVIYKATLAFEINRDMSFAISSYPFIGAMGSFNSQAGASSGASVGVELPILGELYFGDLDDPCFFVGAGFSGSLIRSTAGSSTVVGPQLELGGQFEFRDKLIGARLAYTYGLNKGTEVVGITETRSMFNVGIFYPIGL